MRRATPRRPGRLDAWNPARLASQCDSVGGFRSVLHVFLRLIETLIRRMRPKGGMCARFQVERYVASPLPPHPV
jgi:hypothetical protein